MWQPEPHWESLRSGSGAVTVGVWRTVQAAGAYVVKRLRRPDPDDPPPLSDPTHGAYWRREAELALEPIVADGPGIRPPPYLRVDEDDEGVTVIAHEVTGEPPTGPRAAVALGAFAAAPHEPPAWAARSTLADRLGYAESRGGWPTLARTTFADAAVALWDRRRHWLAVLAGLPQGRVHGDAVAANFVDDGGEPFVGVDWQGFGVDAIGLDAGYLALSAKEDFDVILDAFVTGARAIDARIDPAAARTAATVMAVYTVVSRAEWALARVDAGEGPLAAKFRHPGVAPHLRALQRHVPQVEELLGDG